MFDLAREIWQTLQHNKLRTALTGLAVSWGIFMLIVLLGMARGLLNATNARMDPERYATINVFPGVTSMTYKGYREGRTMKIRTSDNDIMNARHSFYTAGATAVIDIDTARLETSRETVSGGLTGAMPNEERQSRIEMTYGRFINDADIREKRHVLVIPMEHAEVLFKDPEDAIGSEISSMGLSWKVIGVYTSDWNRSSYAPYSLIRVLRGEDDSLDRLRVKVRNVSSGADIAPSEQEVREILARSHNFDPSDDSAMYIWNRMEQYFNQKEIQKILSTVVWIIGLLTLLSGVVGVSNIMFVSVRERTHEIGIRRAIGAKPRSVLLQVIAESVVITTLFGYVGIFMGIIVTSIIDKIVTPMGYLTNTTVDLSIAIEVTVVLIIVGALAGLFPAMKATKVSPVEALRDE